MKINAEKVRRGCASCFYNVVGMEDYPCSRCYGMVIGDIANGWKSKGPAIVEQEEEI